MNEKRPFTLVEFLIVIAIIAILAAMLLPSPSRARETSVGAACQNNLKQVGLGLIMYADHSDGYLMPYALPTTYPKSTSVWGELLEAEGDLSDINTAYCPKLPDDTPGPVYLHTYGMRPSYNSLLPGNRYWHRIADDDAPSDRVWLADSVRNHAPDTDNHRKQSWRFDAGWNYGGGLTANRTTLHFRHSLATQTWFLDGYVKKMSIDETWQLHAEDGINTLKITLGDFSYVAF
jgi:prepilin-type N-terminal cleavage/methylation domain-containing protein